VSNEPANSSTQETVLVVEDEVFIRMVISDYLRGCGYKVIEAANADEALTILQHLEINVDVVFSDIEMPGSMDGFALSTWIRENRAGLDVILAGTVPRAANAAAELCESGPLPKPYEPQVVVDRIRRLMSARATRKRD
jgi:CheY-like chemotaxis protein